MAGQNVYFRHGKPRHIAKDCTVKLSPIANRPQYQGRVFTLNAEEATQSNDLIQGKCEVNDRTLTILYDSGAMHSFISHDCICKLELPLSELPYMLIVSTSTGKPTKICQCCLKCHFQMDGRSFVADLICLPSSGLDLILGMDWLLAKHVVINYLKSIMFPPIPGEPIRLFVYS